MGGGNAILKNMCSLMSNKTLCWTTREYNFLFFIIYCYLESDYSFFLTSNLYVGNPCNAQSDGPLSSIYSFMINYIWCDLQHTIYYYISMLHSTLLEAIKLCHVPYLDLSEKVIVWSCFGLLHSDLIIIATAVFLQVIF